MKQNESTPLEMTGNRNRAFILFFIDKDEIIFGEINKKVSPISNGVKRRQNVL